MIRSLSLFLLVLLTSTVYSQNINPVADEIFREDEIAIIRLTMDPADKDFIYDEANVNSNLYFPATFSFQNSLLDTTLDFSVGVRLRGNTSRYHPKKSLKVKFKEYTGEKFFDQKKFNLKAEVNDPAMVRELLSLRLYRNLDVPAARAHHSEVYINDEYMGLFVNVEQIDDEFVQARFNYNLGNIYKCYWGATLEDNGQVYDEGLYELETNTAINDRSVLANFVSVLNNTSSSNFNVEIEKVFDVDRYLRYLAIEALIGHWDGYSYNQNNYYLYENDETGLVEFIPYDLDNSFGIDWIGGDWGTRDVMDWPKHGEARPLTKKILAQPNYFSRYLIYIDRLLKGEFSEGYYFSIFDNYKLMLSDAISRDTYYPLPFGYSYADFEDSFITQVVNHAPYGMKPYVTTRASLARDQIGVITALSEFSESALSIYPNPSNGKELYFTMATQISKIELFDNQGRNKDFSIQPISDSNYKLEVNLAQGIYLLSIDGNTQKVLVK